MISKFQRPPITVSVTARESTLTVRLSEIAFTKKTVLPVKLQSRVLARAVEY